MSRKLLAIAILVLTITVVRVYADVFPTVELTSFDPNTGTYVYTVTCPANSTYPFGYFQIDAQVSNLPPTGPWIIDGPYVDGVNKAWPKGSRNWDPSGKDQAWWDGLRGQTIPANTAWTGTFILIVPNSQPVLGQAATKDGQVGSFKIHTVLVPGPKPTPPSDTTPPVTTIELDGTIGNNDWYISPVTVTLSATDADSEVLYTEYSLNGGPWLNYEGMPFDITDEGMFDLQARSCDDKGNLEDPPVAVSFKVDISAPEVSGSVASEPNANGWYNTDVQINYTAVDYISGLASPSEAEPGIPVSFTHTVTSEGNNVIDTASATDKAGNVGEIVVSGLRIDKTPPVIQPISWPSGQCHLINYEPAVVRFSVVDAVSGIDGLPWGVANVQPTDGWALPGTINLAPRMIEPGVYEISFVPQVPGIYTIALFAKDLAGNIGQLSSPITFGAGGFKVEWLPPISTMEIYWMVDGSTVPVKFRLLDPCNNDAYVNTYQYQVSVVDSAGNVMLSALVPQHDPTTGGYHVNVQTKFSNNVNWPLGDYTVIISGPGIWDVVSGPYKSKYGLLLVDKGAAKGTGKR